MHQGDDVAVIVVNGQRYYDWKAFRLQRDYGDTVSVFQFVCAEPGPFGKGWGQLRLKPGDRAEVSLGGIKAATCYICDRTAAFDADSHDLVVSGRSITADAVDSSIPIKPGSFNGQTFEQAARAVLQPHGVGLKILNPPDIASKPFERLSVQFGETAHEFIARIASLRGMMLTDDADGNYVAGQNDPGSGSVAELVEGKNIFSGRVSLDDQSAWSRYSGAGQMAGNDQRWPPRDYSATLTNSNVRSNRVVQFISQHQGDSDDQRQAVNHEVARSLWNVVNASITVIGWKRSDGKLWEPAKNVTVRSPMSFPNESGSMLLGIQSVTFTQDAQSGTKTTLELVLPQALSTRGDGGSIGATPGAEDPIKNPIPSLAQPDAPDEA